MTMVTIQDLAPVRDGRTILLVMLPGAYMTAEDFVANGFFGAVRQHAPEIDMVAVETGMDSYMDEDVVEKLHAEIIRPARSRDIHRIWIAGISLGGMGALLYAYAHREAIEGLILISPFIGSRGIIAEIEEAGGLADWSPSASAQPALEQRLLTWLKTYRAADTQWPYIYLAYGRQDRFAAAHRLFADILPDDKVLTAEGGHDWDTWKKLWGQLLPKVSFQSGTAAGVAI